ncbi:CAP domain-containing protein [Arthrobacter sp. I2-34]|uniref:CAP domain-containing protein n=1 Tax=Arthrobacter hankyongi TaxID=2904801 RepID=A0ABS9LAK5_9MICC|nr:CAP domain-containing protein [Arthrobacter hankyongi]MCG2623724.1 CAP domain-containing protein [Arthrobacter hankyongi]
MSAACKLLAVLVLLLGLLASGVAPAQALTRTAQDPFVAEVLRLTNQYRAGAGLPPVVWNQSIANVSQAWAEEQNRRISKDTFTMEDIHREGYGSWQIPAGWDWYTENIGINNTARQIVDWWMASSVHRAGMLNPRATDIGVGWMKTTHPDYHGMYVVVENLAGYPATRATLPQVDLSSFREGDIAAVDAAGNLFAYPSAGGGDMWNRIWISSGWKDAAQIEVADWNADGIQDIVARRSNGNLTVSYGLVLGGLAAPRTIGFGGWSGFDIEVTRWMTADRFPGIIARELASGKAYYYANPSGGTHGARSYLGSGFKNSDTFTVDYDADGRMDLVARTAAGTGQLTLYRSNGAGAFLAETRRIIGSSGWNKITHLSTLPNHLGDGGAGFLARDTSGNIRYYKVTKNKTAAAVYIGRGGWESLKLGS